MRQPAVPRPYPTAPLAAGLGALLLLCACAPSDEEPGGAVPPAGQEPAAQDGEGDGRELVPGEPEDVATGLDVPWGIGFLPDGSALVTERDAGTVVRVEPDGAVSEAGAVPGVEPGGEGGLLGLAVDPDFPEEPYVYVYLTTAQDNRISRFEYDTGTGELAEDEVVFDGIPAAANHNGGRLAFGPDGLLYAATGDAADPGLAQDTDSPAGKILRMTREGGVPEDNPFDNHVYSYGHRNVQGLAWDGQGRLLASEFGAADVDEVNVIEPGGNYGWPEVEGPGGGGELIDPVVSWTPEEASPSGAAVAGGALWVAALRGERLWRVPLEGGDEPLGEPEDHYTGDHGRLRTVVAAPGGEELWLTTSNRDGRGSPAPNDDRILRVPLG